MSNLEGIAYTVATLSQWSSVYSHLTRAWRLEDLPGVDFQIQVPSQLFHSNDNTRLLDITLFKYLELFHLLLIAGNVPQKGEKEKWHIWLLSCDCGRHLTWQITYHSWWMTVLHYYAPFPLPQLKELDTKGQLIQVSEVVT